MSEAGSFLGQDSLLALNCCYKAAEIVCRGDCIITIYRSTGIEITIYVYDKNRNSIREL